MKVVIKRVLERTELRAVSDKPEQVLRRGITLVPRDGVRVVQAASPRPASAAPVAATA
jgi:cytochrome P450